MSNYRKRLLVIALLVTAGVLACSVSVEVERETATPETVLLPTAPMPRLVIEPTETTVAPPTIAPTQPPPPTPTPTPRPPGPNIVSTSDYDVTETVTLRNDGPGTASRIALWVALIGSRAPYQELLARQIEPSTFEVVEDEYGNQFAQLEFRDVAPGQEVVASLNHQVRVRELTYDLSYCQGEVLQAFLEPETYVESDDEGIQALAEQLAQGQANPCQTLEALYDYVREHMTYDEYHPEDHGAAWALEQGSGDCTDFSDALLALSRAAGIPARFLEGVTYSSRGSADPGEVKHDWLEAYLPGHGWVPLDPTWGRFPERREAYFAGMSPDHVIVTVGRSPSTLGGYHYNYYRYWWDGERPALSGDTSWDITKAD